MSEFLQLHFRKSLLGAEQNYYVQLYLEDTGKPGDLRISEVKAFRNRPSPMLWYTVVYLGHKSTHPHDLLQKPCSIGYISLN